MGELFDLNSQIPDNRIPSGIARDTETTAAINTHITAADPHPGYLTQAEGDVRYEQLAQVKCSLVSGIVAAVGVESVVALPVTIPAAKIVHITAQILDNLGGSGTYFVIRGGGGEFSPTSRLVSGNSIRIPPVSASQLVGRPLHFLVWHTL